jgi:hypothetical protein
MQPHEQRVVEERDELQTKTRKLGEFLETQTYSNLPYEDRKLLNIQHATMQAYSEILNTRIGRFI